MRSELGTLPHAHVSPAKRERLCGLALLMTELGNEPYISKCPHGPEVVKADDNSLLDLALATQVRDDAVFARRGALHNAGVAIDGE